MAPQVTDVSEAFDVIGNFGRSQWLTVVPVGLGGNIHIAFLMCLGIFTQYENKPGDGVIIDSAYEEFQFTPLQSQTITSCVMAGVLLGNFFIGKITDTRGRRAVALVLIPVSIFIAVLSTIFTVNWQTYAFFRLIMGIAMGGLTVSVAVLSFELVGTAYWGYIGIANAAAFGLAIAILAQIARVFTSWRLLTLVLTIPNLYLVYFLYICPESPRWLYSVGRVEEAERILRDMGMQNGVARGELDRIHLRRRPSSSSTGADTIADIFKSRPVVTRLFVLVICWFSNSLVYYGLTLGAGDLGENIYESTTFAGLSELPGYVICLMTMEHAYFGRRRSSILYLAVCAVCAGAIDVFSFDGSLKMVLALTAKMLISATFALVYPYTCELFPTSIRSVTLGWCSMCARVGGIVAPFTASLGQIIFKNDDNAGFFVYATFGMISAVLCVILPETLNKGLKDTIADLERTTRRRSVQRTSPEEGQALLEQ